MPIVSQVVICGGNGCMARKSDNLKNEFDKQIKAYNLSGEVRTFQGGCLGFCERGPIVIVFPDQIFYEKVELKDVETIVKDHLLNGKVVKRKMFKEKVEGSRRPVAKTFSEMSFYKNQEKIVLKDLGLINPDLINEYIGKKGYFGLAKAVSKMTPQKVVEEIKKSGLRGRGGGGFLTGLKWEIAAGEKSDQKYVICNGDEGVPGAFMDRSILEGNPHLIIEALIIAGYAIGANKGYIYTRAEYKLALKRIQKAIDKAYEYGFLGKNIFGSDFSFDLEIRLGAGAFIAGEETAVIASIEGDRPMPRNKPPHPAVSGLFGKPTVINNVETLANIPTIINNGAKWFLKIGTKKSPGTKIFALGGKIENAGFVEVPMGIKLTDLINNLGGGVLDNKKFKAVQTGGPTGGFLSEKDLNVKLDFDNMLKKDTMMGSGVMSVLDEDDCIVDTVKKYMEFIVNESCGKCTPCREGSKRMLQILENITLGKGKKEDLLELMDLAKLVNDTSLCGFGKTAGNPVIASIKKFKDEYLTHIEDKKCLSGTCKELVKLHITEKCIGCTRCAKGCPVNCISGGPKERHKIDTSVCIKCGACRKVCPVNAIIYV